MDREQVVALALNAQTLDGVTIAEQTLREWMQAHPDDLAMYEIAGMVGILKKAALERESEPSTHRVPSAIPAT